MRSKGSEWQAPEDDNHKLANLCGPVDANLRQIEAALQVKISRRNNTLSVAGDKENAKQAFILINHFFEKSDKPITADEIQLALVELKNTSTVASPRKEIPTITGADEPVALRTKRGDLQPRTERQKDYLKSVQEHDLTFGIGPAGTGKTYLAVACAVDALERDSVKRIILTRPAVEAGERLGFLPGDLSQKVDPTCAPCTMHCTTWPVMTVCRSGSNAM